MYYKITTLFFLIVYFPELSLSDFQYTKSVDSIKTVPDKELTDESVVPGQNTMFRQTDKLLFRNLISNSKARRVKRNLPMGPRCASDMREFKDRCWPLDKYYDLSGIGEKLKDALKQKNYEEEAIYLMKKWMNQYRRCAKKLTTDNL